MIEFFNKLNKNYSIDIGKKIRLLGIILFQSFAYGSFIVLLYFLFLGIVDGDSDKCIIGLQIFIAGIALALISYCSIAGFGELVDNSSIIANELAQMNKSKNAISGNEDNKKPTSREYGSFESKLKDIKPIGNSKHEKIIPEENKKKSFLEKLSDINPL